MTAEEKLAQSWNANSCGDAICMDRRLQAALKVLAGNKTHYDLAKLIEDNCEKEVHETPNPNR